MPLALEAIISFLTRGQNLKTEIEFAPHLPYKKIEPFFKIENIIIDSGLLAVITPIALKLYLLLKRRAYSSTTYLYTKQIIDNIDVDRTHISRYYKELVKYKLITITHQSKMLGYKRCHITATKDIPYIQLFKLTQKDSKCDTEQDTNIKSVVRH